MVTTAISAVAHAQILIVHSRNYLGYVQRTNKDWDPILKVLESNPEKKTTSERYDERFYLQGVNRFVNNLELAELNAKRAWYQGFGAACLLIFAIVVAGIMGIDGIAFALLIGLLFACTLLIFIAWRIDDEREGNKTKAKKEKAEMLERLRRLYSS